MKSFYHISKTILPIGTKLECRGFPFVTKKVEEILEKYRPDDALPREESVFMFENKVPSSKGLKYSSGYMHKCETLATTFHRDMFWIGQLEKRYHKNQRFRDTANTTISDRELARRYWEGEMSKKPDVEIVSQTATITMLISEDSVPTSSFDPKSLLSL